MFIGTAGTMIALAGDMLMLITYYQSSDLVFIILVINNAHLVTARSCEGFQLDESTSNIPRYTNVSA